jgi:long-chain fatty acid transport protein
MKTKLNVLALAVLIFPSIGFGLGYRIVDQGAEATARGDAFTATADNPSAIYYNPAGITQLAGQSVLLGGYAIYLQTKYTNAGISTRTKDQIGLAPQIFYTNTLKNSPITLGIGVYAPFGLGLEYPDDNPFRAQALKGSIQDITVNPVIAWRINKFLSVAAGVTLNETSAELKTGLPLPFPAPGNYFDFKGSGYTTGFNLGAMWQPTVQHSFGISYHSETITDIKGHTTTFIPQNPYFSEFLSQNADGRFVFPQFIQAGYSYRPTPDWNIEFDLDWTDWHSLKTVTLNQDVSGPQLIPFNWQSSFMYELGATRYFAQDYHFSLGFVYSQTSVPDSSFSPAIPDSDRYILSTGLGWKKGRFSWDFAYQFAYGPPRAISNGLPSDGDYRFISHALTFSVGYHF